MIRSMFGEFQNQVEAYFYEYISKYDEQFWESYQTWILQQIQPILLNKISRPFDI